jgi:phenylpropionate dioxygenase-like ring-hydroxylating dioxygenase large terminal subunit
MGAWNRLPEMRMERQLRESSRRGVLEPADGRTKPYDLFVPGADENTDTRVGIPALGLREYWYPVIEARKIKAKPVFWVMLGEELVLFRDKDGEVAALSDACPHRGASLSAGDCFYRGSVTCPYHGATFDGQGNCMAWLTEGPDSKMVGKVSVRHFPTRTLKGWVFVWMGDTAPAPIEEDVPPEFFEPESTLICSTYTYWRSNWLIAIENQNDAHNCDFVHRNSVKQFLGFFRGRSRTPLSPKSEIINDRAVVIKGRAHQNYYGPGDPSRAMYYPGVDGVWPLYRLRRLWHPFFNRMGKGRMRREDYDTPAEWASAHHLPSAVRVNYGRHMYTRYAVPVEANLSRIVFYHMRRLPTKFARLKERVYFFLIHNWLQNYNFSAQDNHVAAPCRFWTQENLSPTDSHLIMLRRLIRERSRDAVRRRSLAQHDRVTAGGASV